MPRWPIAVLAALLAALALAACGPRQDTRVADRGIGGTGVSPGVVQGDEMDAGGIGGTGIAGEDRGIGGTGIFGTITGFGSILVNGLTVDFDPGVPVATNLGTGSSADLRVGQVVAIEADEGDGRLAARRIEIQHEVSGPVTRVDADRGEIEVLGQIVRRPADAPLGDTEDLGLMRVRPGDWVEVSGLRDAEGAILASRIDSRPAGGLASLRGTVTEAGAGGLRVGGLAVTGVPGAVQPGSAVLAVGRVNDAGLAAERLRVEPRLPFGGRLQRLSIEGVVRQAEGGRFKVGRFDLAPGRLPAGTESLRPGARVLLEGTPGVSGAIATQRLRLAPQRRPGGRSLTPQRPQQRLAPPSRPSSRDRPERTRERSRDRSILRPQTPGTLGPTGSGGRSRAAPAPRGSTIWNRSRTRKNRS